MRFQPRRQPKGDQSAAAHDRRQIMTPDRLTLTALENFPLIENGDDLATLVIESIRENSITIGIGDVLVVAQKIVSKAEGRQVPLDTVTPGGEAKRIAEKTAKDPRLVELILRESKDIVRQTDSLIISENKLGMIMANAGIDQSNIVEGQALLLPADPDRSAQQLCLAIQKELGVRVAVIIADSIGRAWRRGIVGHAIGVSGIPAILDLRSSPDLFGRELRVTEVGFADEIAAAATLLMGQGDEGKPVVVVSGLPDYGSPGSAKDILRDKERDLFR